MIIKVIKRKAKKYVQIYILFLVYVFLTSCRQKQTEPHDDTINYNIEDTITAYRPHTMMRNIKKGRNGTILIAASFGGVFRYEGKLCQLLLINIISVL